MSFMDSKWELCDGQAITGTAVSDQNLDLEEYGAPDMSLDRLFLNIRVGSDAFTLLTSLDFVLETDDDAAFGSAVEVISRSMALAQLVAGAVVMSISIPTEIFERYTQLTMTVTGTNPDAGAIDAWSGLEPIQPSLNIQKDPTRA